MFKIGDLVRRVKILSVTENDSAWVDYDDPNDCGVIVDIEKPIHETKLLNLTYPQMFVKVHWQTKDYGAIWHWGDEVVVIRRANKS